MWEFIRDRWDLIAYNALQHANLVFQAVFVATLVAVALAVVVNRFRFLDPIANTLSAIGLTIPSFALVGLLLPLTKIGRSEEHTSELQSLMRISSAVFFLKKKK